MGRYPRPEEDCDKRRFIGGLLHQLGSLANRLSLKNETLKTRRRAINDGNVQYRLRQCSQPPAAESTMQWLRGGSALISRLFMHACRCCPALLYGAVTQQFEKLAFVSAHPRQRRLLQGVRDGIDRQTVMRKCLDDDI